jgi:hypothetical protein
MRSKLRAIVKIWHQQSLNLLDPMPSSCVDVEKRDRAARLVNKGNTRWCLRKQKLTKHRKQGLEKVVHGM